jgi:hypothetical protein
MLACEMIGLATFECQLLWINLNLSLESTQHQLQLVVITPSPRTECAYISPQAFATVTSFRPVLVGYHHRGIIPDFSRPISYYP